MVLPPNRIGTGNSLAGQQTRFSFVAPYDVWFIRAIFGFFADYTFPTVWYQEGTITPAEAAAAMSKVYTTLGVDVATIGAIIPFAGGILPSGWLVCDGSSLLRTDYPDLYAAIGTVWGSVDSQHFNIPDLRGKVLLGQGTNPNTGSTFNLGDNAGEETHTLTAGEMPSHTHAESTAVASVAQAPVAPVPAAIPGIGITGATGGGGAHNNMQPYAVVNYAIIAQ